MDDLAALNRDRQLERLASDEAMWDIVVIGGGATGLGVAVDALSRGYRTVLVEAHDFGKGTSSRSTKLVHGGVRYLQQGRVGLVKHALEERGRLRQNAPHLVRSLSTIVPLYAWWEGTYYGLGMKVYEWLSGQWSLGPSRRLSVDETLAMLPTLEPRGLRGGVLYLDGAFDDARLLVSLAQTAVGRGGVCLNYAPVRELVKESGRVCGVVAEDMETGSTHQISGRVVVNATGPFSDLVRHLDAPAATNRIAPSQGIHLVFDHEWMPSEAALIVPRTRDGRVVFAIPWHGRVMVGTTDTPLDEAPLDPQPRPGEIDFLLETIGPYWAKAPTRGDIRAVFAGIRPLARSGNAANTAKLSRDHIIEVSPSGLVSIMGGKWTTYRKMAEECVDRAVEVGGLTPAACVTKTLRIHGGDGESLPGVLSDYGSDGQAVEQLIASRPDWREPLDPRLPYQVGQVVWAARHELARTAEDVLARRLRALFLDADAALAAAPRVVEILAAELGRDANWQTTQRAEFAAVAKHFQPPTNMSSPTSGTS